MHVPNAHDPAIEQLTPKRGPFETQSGLLALAGAALVGLAIFFGWNDLALSTEYLVGFAGVILLVCSVVARDRAWRVAVSMGLPIVGAVGVAWQAYAPTVPIAIGLLGLGGIGVIHVVMHWRSERTQEGQGRHLWLSGALAVLAGSWAAYYQFLSLDIAAGSTGRRMVLTIVWLIGGLVAMALGKRRGERAIGEAGMLVAAFAVGKAMFYDTSHLVGIQRTMLCAVAGLVLFAGAALMRSSERT